MKTRHAIMFRLSNKIVQVDFTDKTVIVLSSEQKLVTYINAKGEKSEYPLATALDSRNADMAKRLKYTKEILTHMLNGTTPFANLEKEQDPSSIKSSTGTGWNSNKWLSDRTTTYNFNHILLTINRILVIINNNIMVKYRNKMHSNMLIFLIMTNGYLIDFNRREKKGEVKWMISRWR